MHPTDDDLVLHYYGELPAADDARVAAHLGGCEACHGAYRRLQQVLLSVNDATLPDPDLPAGFERTVWARLAPALPASRRGWFGALLASPSRLAWGTAAALLVVAAFMAGRLSSPAPAPGAVAHDEVRERILLLDLSDHLDRSQRVLVELVSADAAQAADLVGGRARAEDLVSANRLYRQTATAAGDASVVDLLDQLERVLVQVAAGPDRMSPRELDDVQRRIEAGSLLFKVRVVSSDLETRRRAAAQQPHPRSSL